jgi:NADPH2:quinone reductase
MKAIQITEYGGPEVLQLREVVVPTPGAGQALIDVKAAGLNFVDIYHRRGTFPVPLPYIPGHEGSGIVEAVGEGVNNVQPGDRVAWVDSLGAYAEKAVVNAEKLLPLPDGVSFELGAALPLQGLTAHYLIHEFRLPKPGETTLIHAAAGGMGLLLVQWAKHLGARVFGTVSTEEKAKAARDAGADEVILYTTQDFVAETKRLTNDRGVELIIDGVGKTTFTGNLEAAARRGNIVVYGAASGPADPFSPNSLGAKSITVSGGSLPNYTLTREETERRARDLFQGLQQGWLKFRIDHVLPLAQAAEAQRRLERRQTIGKVILKVE